MAWRLAEPGTHYFPTGPIGRVPARGSYLGLSLNDGTGALEHYLHPSPLGQNQGNQLAEREAFRRALLQMEIDARAREGKRFIVGIENSQLAPIVDGQRMRSDVAKLFLKMWREVSEAHKARKGAAKGDSIGVASGYRTAEEDNRSWNRNFDLYCRLTRERRLRVGDEYGQKALKIMFAFSNRRKAPPGYSGHTHGIAADLKTTEAGRDWIVKSEYHHQVGWQKTWLYQWMVENAWKHGFYQLKSETWHWEYHEGTPPSQCWGGKVKARPIPMDPDR
jgi:hypothetical protein